MQCIAWTTRCMPKKMSCIKTRSYKLTKGIGGNTHQDHRDQNKMLQFHGRRQMLQSNFDWHEGKYCKDVEMFMKVTLWNSNNIQFAYILVAF
jgi:hypothetical protein